MRRVKLFVLFTALLPVAACAVGETGVGLGGSGRGGSSPVITSSGGSTATTSTVAASTGQTGSTAATTTATTSASSGATTTTTTTGSGGPPANCSEAHGSIGCCVGSVAYWCSGSSLTTKPCTGNETCGWNSSHSYYSCVSSPGGADPSGHNPIHCN